MFATVAQTPPILTTTVLTMYVQLFLIPIRRTLTHQKVMIAGMPVSVKEILMMTRIVMGQMQESSSWILAEAILFVRVPLWIHVMVTLPVTEMWTVPMQLSSK
jgi:hypothetical protein